MPYRISILHESIATLVPVDPCTNLERAKEAAQNIKKSFPGLVVSVLNDDDEVLYSCVQALPT